MFEKRYLLQKAWVICLIIVLLMLCGCKEYILIRTSTNSTGNDTIWSLVLGEATTNYSVMIDCTESATLCLTVYGESIFYDDVGFFGDVILNKIITQSALTGNNNFNRPTYAPHICDNDGSGNGMCLNETQINITGSCPTGQAIQDINNDGTVICQSATSFNHSHNQNLNTSNAVTFVNVTVTNTLTTFVKAEQEFLQSGSVNSHDPFIGFVNKGAVVQKAGTKEHPGIITIRDSTSVNGGYAVGTDFTTFQSMLLSGDEQGKFIFRDDTTKMTTFTKMGFMDSKNATAIVDGCYIQLNKHNVTGICVNNSVSATTTTKYIIPSRTLWYKAVITINTEATSVLFQLFNSTTAVNLLWNATLTTRIPTVTGRETNFAWVAYETTVDAAADIVSLDYMSLEIRRILNR